MPSTVPRATFLTVGLSPVVTCALIPVVEPGLESGVESHCQPRRISEANQEAVIRRAP